MIVPALHTFEPGDAITFEGGSGEARAAAFARRSHGRARAIRTEAGIHKAVCDERALVIFESDLRGLLARAAQQQSDILSRA